MYIHKYVPIRGQWFVPLIPLIRWYLSQFTLLRIDQSKSDDGDDVGSKPLTHIPRTLPSYIENSCPRKPKIILKLTIYICKKKQRNDHEQQLNRNLMLDQPDDVMCISAFAYEDPVWVFFTT